MFTDGVMCHECKNRIFPTTTDSLLSMWTSNNSIKPIKLIDDHGNTAYFKDNKIYELDVSTNTSTEVLGQQSNLIMDTVSNWQKKYTSKKQHQAKLAQLEYQKEELKMERELNQLKGSDTSEFEENNTLEENQIANTSTAEPVTQNNANKQEDSSTQNSNETAHMSWWARRKAKKKAQQEIQLKQEKQQAKEHQKQVELWQHEDLSKHAAKIDGLVLKNNEYCYLAIAELINWKENRTKTKKINYGGLTGSFHIAKGINYRLGSINTDSQKINYIVTLFTGALFLTNKRIILVNRQGSKAFLLSGLLRAIPYSDGVALIRSSGKQVILDGFSDAEKFNIYLDRIVSGEDILPKKTTSKKTTLKKDSSTKSSQFNELRELKKLLDDGIITQDEFEAKKKQILGI